MPRFLSREGHILPGEKRIVTVAQPAAGAGWAVTVPGGRQWRIQGATAQLVTDAVAANRLPIVTLSDQTTTWWRVGVDVNIPASTTQLLSLGAGPQVGGSEVAGFPITLPLPDMYLPAGTQLTVTTTAEDVGDQWSAIAVMIEEVWMDDQMITTADYIAEGILGPHQPARPGQTGA